MRVSGFRFADESLLPSCTLLICREVETVIHVNGHVKDIYTQKSTFFYMVFTTVIMHLITRSMLLFFVQYGTLCTYRSSTINQD